VNNSLVPTFTGIAVIQLLEKHFKPFVDLGFTSKMEASLDDIAEGDLEWLPYLKEFFLGKNGLQNQIKREEKNIDPEESRSVNLAHIKDVKIKIGRYGAYIVKESEKWRILGKKRYAFVGFKKFIQPSKMKKFHANIHI
jgi:DNA topoisomerase-1